MYPFDVRAQLFSDRTPRLWLSEGTVPVSGQDLALYEPNSVVPQPRWQLASPSDVRSLYSGPLACAVHRWEQGRSIAVLPVPGAFIDALSPLQLPSIRSFQEFQLLRERSDYSDVLRAAIGELWPLLVSEDGVEMFPIVFRNPGQRTSTFEAQRRRLVGLHLDACDVGSIAQRASARNRICINLGREPRRFLYVDLPLAEMSRRVSFAEAELAQPCPAGFAGLPDRVGYKFLRSFPEYPVVAVEVMPGEAYIAPTENLLHDGTTLHQTMPDLTITLLGHFAPETVNEGSGA